MILRIFIFLEKKIGMHVKINKIFLKYFYFGPIRINLYPTYFYS